MNRKDQILGTADRKTAKVETPEWGGDIHVRALSHAERRALFATQQKDPDLYLARLAATVICDESGVRIFDDADAARLAEKSSIVLDRIAAAFMKLNGVDPEERKEIAKNS